MIQRKFTVLISLALLLVCCSLTRKQPPAKSDISISELLSKMTLKEKVGQMTQLNIDVVSKGKVYSLVEPHELDIEKLKKAIVEYGVGSILNAGSHAYSQEHWNTIVQTIQNMATNQTRLKVPVLYGIDAIHGAGYLTNGTLLPQPLAQAATFNPSLVYKGASVTAYETRACGIPWNFSPVLDVARQPLWSRVFETYGEDVYLCKQMGLAAIQGYQGSNAANPEKVAACLKHFLGYSIPFSGKDRTTTYIPERQLREYFLPTFEAAIKEGALSLMVNSGDINGIPVHADKEILTTLLRDELGFRGVAVTDWEDIMKLEHPHRIASTLKEAVKLAVNAGIDMSMVPNDYRFSDLLLELVNEGEVPMKRIDEAVSRILTMKKKLGLFKTPFSPSSHSYPLVASDSFIQISYETAAESITLLKNEGNILPLNKTQKILVSGPTANSLTNVNGAWTRTWQGTDPKWNDESKRTIYEALQYKGGQVSFAEGSGLDSIIDIAAAVQKSNESDVIVVCLGEKPSTEKPGDIHSLDIEKTQVALVKELGKTGKPIVLVLVENRPRIVREIEPLCQAILMAYQPSENGTDALADIIYGQVNPSGKLPITYPRYTNTLLAYDHKYTDLLDTDFSENAFNPQWEFGHGMSYTNYEYSNLKVTKDTFNQKDELHITVNVKNTGSQAGKETVLVFVSDQVASITPSVKRLRAFKKMSIKPNETKEFKFAINAQELAFIGKDLTWVTEDGEYLVSVGNLSKKIVQKNNNE